MEKSIPNPIGNESNIGKLRDIQRNFCCNRYCSSHTHFNVLDKELNQNVNPLDLIE